MCEWISWVMILASPTARSARRSGVSASFVVAEGVPYNFNKHTTATRTRTRTNRPSRERTFAIHADAGTTARWVGSSRRVRTHRTHTPHRTHAPHDTKTHSSKRTSHRIVRPGREDPRATDIMCSHAERRTQTDRGDRRTVVARFQFVPVAPLVSHHALTTLSRQVRSGPFRPDRKIVSACTSAGGVCATAPSPCRCTRAAPPAREEQTDERDHSPAQHTYSPRRLRSPAKASGAPRAAAQPSWLVTAISCGQYPCCG